MYRFLVVALIVAVSSTAFVESAEAQENVQVHAFYGGQGFGGHYHHFGTDPYASGRIPTPPYFAIHPPVYYSYPVPRPYGYTPYAYPAYVMTPTAKVEEPEAIINPYVNDTEDKPAAEPPHKKASHGVIINPFVKPNAKSKLASHEDA